MTLLAANALIMEAEPVQVPAMHYVFVEGRGDTPANAPQAWGELHAGLITEILFPVE